MRFYLYKYINSVWTWVEVNVEIEPALVKAWDTTNDTFSCSLEVNQDAEPYKPMTPFKIVDDNNQTTIMWVVNDTVTIFSLSPLCYKHALSLVQYRYFLNKHIVRNSVFNQPKISKQKLYTAVNSQYKYYLSNGYFYEINNESDEMLYWADQTIINPHGKLKDIVLEYCFYYVRGTNEEDENGDKVPVTLQKLTANVFPSMNATLRTNTYIRFCDANNSDYQIASFKIFDYERNVKTPIPVAVANAINSYIRNRGNNPVRLYAKYDAELDTGETEIDPEITHCFLKTVDPSLQGKVDTDIFKPIVLQVNIYFDLFNYTMYDVIDTLLKQYRLETYNGVTKREQLFNLPAAGSDLYKLLTTTYPPDTLSFTQATFYDALTEIFRFYDAGFKFDENKTLQIEYYNDPQENRSEVEFSGKSMSFSEKNYNSGRVAYYQNSLQRVTIPRISTRSINLGVPEKNEFAIIVPQPIYSLTNISILLSGTNIHLCGSDGMKTLNNMEVDLTPFIVNRDVWSVLDRTNSPLSVSDYQHLYQETTIPFDRGSNAINISTYHIDWADQQDKILEYVIDIAVRRFFGQPKNQVSVSYSSFSGTADKWYNQRFSIIYDTLVNGRLETKTINDQYAGETIVNQSAGMIDVSKLGLNILGESLKDGQPTLTVTCELTDWDSRIKEGDYIIYNGSRWVANIVNYKPIKDGVYYVTAEFSKNFNALSLRVNTDKEKRLTAISKEQSVVSEDSYIDYVYVSDSNMMPSRDEIIFRGNTIGSLVGQTFGLPASSYDIKTVDVASIITYGSNGAVNEFGNLGWLAGNIIIPLVKYGAGNCLCFEVQYDSPILAGYSLTHTGSNPVTYRSYAILYTDDEGWGDWVTIRFHQNQNVSYGNYPVLSSAGDVAKIDRLKYYKKPNEIFALNYELCFLPIVTEINSFFIGNAFIKNNFFTNDAKIKRNFYLYYDDNYEYSVLDQKGYESSSKLAISFATHISTTVVILNIITSSTITAEHWAICDDNGDIYFASNHRKTFTNKQATTTSIYFTTRRTKMTEQDTLVEVPAIGVPNTYTFTVTPDDWREKPAYHDLNVGATVSTVSIDNKGQGSGTYQSLILVGKTLASLEISAGEGGTNTVSFDSATGTFSYTLHGVNVSIGDTLTATITYRVVGAVAYSMFDYNEIVPELVLQNLTNIAISPARDSLWFSYINTVHFNASQGKFYGTVYKEVKPVDDVTYTITYTIV